MKETTLQAILQGAGIIVGALGYHLTRRLPKPKALTPLKMYDSVTIDNLPAGGDYYLAYVDGWSEVTPAKIRAKFPKAKVLTFTTKNIFLAQFFDVEKGAGAITQVVGWFHMCIDYGIETPGFYASLSNMPALQETLAKAGINRKEYLLIVADWDGKAVIPKGYNGKQYLSTPKYDASVLGRKAFG